MTGSDEARPADGWDDAYAWAIDKVRDDYSLTLVMTVLTIGALAGLGIGRVESLAAELLTGATLLVALLSSRANSRVLLAAIAYVGVCAIISASAVAIGRRRRRQHRDRIHRADPRAGHPVRDPAPHRPEPGDHVPIGDWGPRGVSADRPVLCVHLRADFSDLRRAVLRPDQRSVVGDLPVLQLHDAQHGRLRRTTRPPGRWAS